MYLHFLKQVKLIQGIKVCASTTMLSIALVTCPVTTFYVLAQPWWVAPVTKVFLDAAISVTGDWVIKNLLIQNTRSSTQSVPFDKAIEEYISAKRVQFINDKEIISGKITEAEVRRTDKAMNSGAIGIIKWEDDVYSSILFLKNQRVRVWAHGKEYRGQWRVYERNLYVKTDQGAFYRFY